MKITLQELAKLTAGTIDIGEAELVLTGFSSIHEAEAGDVTFLGNPKYAKDLAKSRASAVLAQPGFNDVPQGLAVVHCENPTLAFSSIIQKFGPQPQEFMPGVHASAVVSASAMLEHSNSRGGAFFRSRHGCQNSLIASKNSNVGSRISKAAGPRHELEAIHAHFMHCFP